MDDSIGGSFPGLRGIPLYAYCRDLYDGIFPPAIERLLSIVAGARGWRHAGPVRWQRPAVLERRLKGLRGDRQLDRYLRETAKAKDLVSLCLLATRFLNTLAATHVDSLAFQRARRLLGKRPTRLRFLRAALRFWAESE